MCLQPVTKGSWCNDHGRSKKIQFLSSWTAIFYQCCIMHAIMMISIQTWSTSLPWIITLTEVQKDFTHFCYLILKGNLDGWVCWKTYHTSITICESLKVYHSAIQNKDMLMHFKPVESVLCPYNQFLQSPDPKQLQCQQH
jgi:hypothetical protein